jgi:hypothetical protein
MAAILALREGSAHLPMQKISMRRKHLKLKT